MERDEQGFFVPGSEPIDWNRVRTLAMKQVMDDLEEFPRAILMNLICKATVILAKRATR